MFQNFGRRCLTTGMVCFLLSSLWCYPHSPSYFNELAGGPLQGHRHLIDSNADWGQDLLYLRAWSDAHPEKRPLKLIYYGMLNPTVVDRANFVLPDSGEFRNTLTPRGAGWCVVSVCMMHGLEFWGYSLDGDRRWMIPNAFVDFSEREELGRVGYSYIVYRVVNPPDPESANSQ